MGHVDRSPRAFSRCACRGLGRAVGIHESSRPPNAPSQPHLPYTSTVPKAAAAAAAPLQDAWHRPPHYATTSRHRRNAAKVRARLITAILSSSLSGQADMGLAGRAKAVPRQTSHRRSLAAPRRPGSSVLHVTTGVACLSGLFTKTARSRRQSCHSLSPFPLFVWCFSCPVSSPPPPGPTMQIENAPGDPFGLMTAQPFIWASDNGDTL